MLRKRIEIGRNDSPEDYEPSVVAESYLRLGDKDQAFVWLNKVQAGCLFLHAVFGPGLPVFTNVALRWPFNMTLSTERTSHWLPFAGKPLSPSSFKFLNVAKAAETMTSFSLSPEEASKIFP
jgi:hypothetical protein